MSPSGPNRFSSQAGCGVCIASTDQFIVDSRHTGCYRRGAAAVITVWDALAGSVVLPKK